MKLFAFVILAVLLCVRANGTEDCDDCSDSSGSSKAGSSSSVSETSKTIGIASVSKSSSSSASSSSSGSCDGDCSDSKGSSDEEPYADFFYGKKGHKSKFKSFDFGSFSEYKKAMLCKPSNAHGINQASCSLHCVSNSKLQGGYCNDKNLCVCY